MTGLLAFGIGASVTGGPGAIPVASNAGGSTTQGSSSQPATQVVPPAHQTYNAQAPMALQGSTVNVTLTVKEQLVSMKGACW